MIFSRTEAKNQSPLRNFPRVRRPGAISRADELCLVRFLNTYRTMDIKLPDDKPFTYRPHRLSYSEREKVRRIVGRLLENSYCNGAEKERKESLMP
ncbi:hypothetical protein ILUMI_16589 [Ignelater luminosus]|uniref:Uncharacterized protein n=1 Tax=Ignelater luminosus TaxID=2038154 RepID=A0A8K0CLG5_IGNLU|nr:hypothetical protein ILUMI_16589 [Ignelater luminosus]